jgi:hypothetical protein
MVDVGCSKVVDVESSAPPGALAKRKLYERIACEASTLRARKGANVDARQCYLQQLCQVPGVSHTIATGIAAEYGTMGELCARLSGPPERAAALLQLLPHVGPVLSLRIHASLHGGGAEAEVTRGET